MSKKIVILTGAGISAESGIRTFRDQNGLWENHRIEDVATPEAFRRNPKLVHQFYNARRAQLKDANVKPNPAHLALAHLEKNWQGEFLLITQNVDNLHERAGNQKMIKMHGSLDQIWCLKCSQKYLWTEDCDGESVCPKCSKSGGMRPDIVWFGEMPYQMDEIMNSLDDANLFLAIGTSGQVYPAAGLVKLAFRAHKIEVNLKQTSVTGDFDEVIEAPAGVALPKLVERLLGS